jgi:hypothetical protein
MTKIITTIALFICSFLSAQQFEQGMAQAMKLWGEDKNTEATALFERIAAADKTSYLPNYYVATVNCFAAFRTKDPEQINALLAKAQAALDIEMAKNPNNAELLVMQAMIHTALLSSDPMKYGMTLPAKVGALYAKAEAIAPENPRVVYGKAEFAIGGAKWTGANVKDLCKDVERSIGLFASFKLETPFSPNWGLERAKRALENCGK